MACVIPDAVVPIGVPAAFGLYVLGTSLPIMVFSYAILLPGYLNLTGSVVTTVILGGLSNAGLHIFESWGGTDALLSLIFSHLPVLSSPSSPSVPAMLGVGGRSSRA